ncbi:MAG: FAD-dependent oxidoreductase [Patescibacteria group bacterium]
MKNQTIYPLIIIGGGPAGLTASIYASRYGIKNLLLTESPGGTIAYSHSVGNWPSEIEISGIELTQKFEKSARHYGGEIEYEKVVLINKKADLFEILTNENHTFLAKAILLTIGTKRRKLNIESEAKFINHGVNYCATCDGSLYKNKTVVVVGGGNAGVGSALILSKIAKKIYLLESLPELRAEKVWLDDLAKTETEIILNNQIIEIAGDKEVEKIILAKDYNGSREIKTDAVFVEIGVNPQSDLVDALNLEKDEWGYVKVNPKQLTSVPGIWAAGDITSESDHFQQVLTACAEGAIAINSINQFLKK